GDSTLMTHPRYVDLVAAALPWVAQASIAMPGLDPFAYYCMAHSVLASKPRLLVMIANLRLLRPDPRRSDLVSLVPSDRLLEVANLPLYSVNVTVPGALLERVLSWPPAEDLFFTTQGVRHAFWDQLTWPYPPPLVRVVAGIDSIFERYDDQVSERHPGV